MQQPALLLINIGQLLTLRGNSTPRRGPELKELGIIEDAAVLCLGGKIVSVGKSKDALRDSWLKKNRKQVIEIDCEHQVVLPGFVDSHTHPAFISPRLVDFEQRISGATYEQIAEAGGGIRSSVEGVRKAGKSALTEKVLHALHEMAEQGTTTVEAKSGYGLTVESELKSLGAIHDAAARWPGTVVATLLGAHVVPKEFQGKVDEYVKEVCEKMIPQATKRKLAHFVDVFTERGAFSAENTARIFEAARKHGLGVRAHVCQLSETSLQQLLRYNPASFDHMDHVNDDDIRALAQHDTIATLVPGANYFLGLDKYSSSAKADRRGRAGRFGDGLQPGLITHAQHAVRVVAGLHSHEDVAGRSHFRRHHQRRPRVAARRTQGLNRAGERRRPGNI